MCTFLFEHNELLPSPLLFQSPPPGPLSSPPAQLCKCCLRPALVPIPVPILSLQLSPFNLPLLPVFVWHACDVLVPDALLVLVLIGCTAAVCPMSLLVICTCMQFLLGGDASQWDRALQMPHYHPADMPAISLQQGEAGRVRDLGPGTTGPGGEGRMPSSSLTYTHACMLLG